MSNDRIPEAIYQFSPDAWASFDEGMAGDKDRQRAELARLTDEYLARGGQIHYCEVGESALDPIESPSYNGGPKEHDVNSARIGAFSSATARARRGS